MLVDVLVLAMCAMTGTGVDSATAPEWMGPNSARMWAKAVDYGMTPEQATEVFREVNYACHATVTEEMLERYREWKKGGVDVVSFVAALFKSDDVAFAPERGSYYYTRSDFLTWLSELRDPRGVDVLLDEVSVQLKQPIETEETVDFLELLFRLLGFSRDERAIDLLFKLQSKEFWEADDAPRVSIKRGRAMLSGSGERVDEKARWFLRDSALAALSLSGNERVVHAFGSGEGIAEDLRGTASGHFPSVVRVNVGIIGLYGERGLREDRLPPETLKRIRKIYEKYGKKYVRVKENRKASRKSIGHVDFRSSAW